MDLNKLMLIGNVGADPEYHTMQNSGNELAKFSLATSRKWTKDGQDHEDVQWHNVIVFNPHLIQNVVKKFIKKGTRLYLEGEVKTRSYEKEGIKQYITEVIVPQYRGEIILLGRGKGDNGNSTGGSDTQNPSPPSPDDFDDDIPF